MRRDGPSEASRAGHGSGRGGRWGDLGVRVVSGLILAGLGALSVLVGGSFFLGMTVLIFAVMGWELAALTDHPKGQEGGHPVQRLVIGCLAGLGLALAQWGGIFCAGLLLAPLALVLTERRDKALLAVYALVMLLAATVFVALDLRGGIIVVWLVCVVVASDVFGYFAGRLIGGPKFWPAISPKKTWAGTIAGWIGAACLGAGFALWTGGGWSLVLISPLVAFAGQMGDIVESLIKRRAGVKDASNLIPGHGGVLDRFDALIGAMLAVGFLEFFVRLPLGLAG